MCVDMGGGGVTLSGKGSSQGVHEKGGSQGVHKKLGSREPCESPGYARDCDPVTDSPTIKYLRKYHHCFDLQHLLKIDPSYFQMNGLKHNAANRQSR